MSYRFAVGCLLACLVMGCGKSSRPINQVKEGMTAHEVRKLMGPPDHVEYGNCWAWGEFRRKPFRAEAGVCFSDGRAVLVIGRD